MAAPPPPRTYVVEYAPPGGAAFRLKLVVPGDKKKTVGALAKAFIKSVAKTRPAVDAIDLDAHYLALPDGSYLNPTRLAAEAIPDGAAALTLREEPPEKPSDDGAVAPKLPGSNVLRDTAYLTFASVAVPSG